MRMATLPVRHQQTFSAARTVLAFRYKQGDIQMNIIWLGHGSFRIEVGDQVLLVDPWLNGNPMMEGYDKDAAIAGATHILVTHGHGDHTADVVEISGKTGAPVSGMVELAQALFAAGATEGHAFNKGGTITLGNVAGDLFLDLSSTQNFLSAFDVSVSGLTKNLRAAVQASSKLTLDGDALSLSDMVAQLEVNRLFQPFS